MNKVNTLCAAALLFLSVSAEAQVKFKLSYDFETEYYTASVVPEVSYEYPQNITAPGQVTIKVPTNAFHPVEIMNHLAGVTWEANSRSNSPDEAPEFDYISFGSIIAGSYVSPNYVAGEELPLFSFKNAYGCNTNSGQSTAIYLIDNATDPFMPPNSELSNPGNSLTIMGAEGVDFGGIIAPAECHCDPAMVLSSKEEIGLGGHSIFPNPAAEFVNVKVEWDGEVGESNILILDATGKQVSSTPMSLSGGKNIQKVQVEDLPAGSYWVYLAGKDWKFGLDRFTKQ
jgi:hypothetical protein